MGLPREDCWQEATRPLLLSALLVPLSWHKALVGLEDMWVGFSASPRVFSLGLGSARLGFLRSEANALFSLGEGSVARFSSFLGALI